MATKRRPAARKNAEKFTWRLENYSKHHKNIYSDTFIAGGYKWRILVLALRNCDKFLAIFLNFADEKAMPGGGSVPVDFSLTLVDQVNGSASVRRSSVLSFYEKWFVMGFQPFVPLVSLLDPGNGLLVDDALVIEAEVSTEVAADQPHEAIRESVTGTLSPQTQVDNPANASGTTSSPFSPSSVQLMSRKLIAELSTMTKSGNCPASDGISSPNLDHASDLLQQQREKLAGFLDMSLEAICQTKSLDEVEKTALEVAEHPTIDPLEKAVLEDLVSRLSDFKNIVPSSLSTIESSSAVESSVAQTTKEMEARLVKRKRELSSLEAEVSSLGDEGTKLEAEIQKLSAFKAKIMDHRDSTMVELERANQKASKELDELKAQCVKGKQAAESRMRAKEKLAHSNASWKLFKENLGW